MKNLLTVVFAAFALLVVPGGTMGQHPNDGIDAIAQQLNDPHEPGSVLVFPKFLRGTVQTESGVQPKTEIEISIRCPKSQPGQTVTCPDATVNLRAHWVCPSGNVFAPCLETDLNLNRTVHGTLYFNPEVPFP